MTLKIFIYSLHSESNVQKSNFFFLVSTFISYVVMMIITRIFFSPTQCLTFISVRIMLIVSTNHFYLSLMMMMMMIRFTYRFSCLIDKKIDFFFLLLKNFAYLSEKKIEFDTQWKTNFFFHCLFIGMINLIILIITGQKFFFDYR